MSIRSFAVKEVVWAKFAYTVSDIKYMENLII